MLKETILFQVTKIYITKNKLHTKVFRKKKDTIIFVNINSESNIITKQHPI